MECNKFDLQRKWAFQSARQSAFSDEFSAKVKMHGKLRRFWVIGWGTNRVAASLSAAAFGNHWRPVVAVFVQWNVQLKMKCVIVLNACCWNRSSCDGQRWKRRYANIATNQNWKAQCFTFARLTFSLFDHQICLMAIRLSGTFPRLYGHIWADAICWPTNALGNAVSGEQLVYAKHSRRNLSKKQLDMKGHYVSAAHFKWCWVVFVNDNTLGGVETETYQAAIPTDSAVDQWIGTKSHWMVQSLRFVSRAIVTRLVADYESSRTNELLFAMSLNCRNKSGSSASAMWNCDRLNWWLSYWQTMVAI